MKITVIIDSPVLGQSILHSPEIEESTGIDSRATLAEFYHEVLAPRVLGVLGLQRYQEPEAPCCGGHAPAEGQGPIDRAMTQEEIEAVQAALRGEELPHEDPAQIVEELKAAGLIQKEEEPVEELVLVDEPAPKPGTRKAGTRRPADRPQA
jgi:hypothetical protein